MKKLRAERAVALEKRQAALREEWAKKKAAEEKAREDEIKVLQIQYSHYALIASLTS